VRHPPLLIHTPKGLYCRAGDFHVDPSRAVDTALITHAHSDHARRGAKRYFCVQSCEGLLRERLGAKINVTPVRYGEKFDLGEARISFHPAGHILGSAQVRIEAGGEVWVVSGDYKRDPDPTCEPFEPIACDVFVTEATFGLPMYRWENPEKLGSEIHDWWMRNAADGINSILFAYSLGKAQRVLAELAPFADRPVLVHPSMVGINECYLREGVRLAPFRPIASVPEDERTLGELILAPPQCFGTRDLLRFGKFRTGFASGWMQGSGFRRYDRGFPLSDHADWPSLLRTIEETGARAVYVAHRDDHVLVRHLKDRGLKAGLVTALSEVEDQGSWVQTDCFAPGSGLLPTEAHEIRPGHRR
jgi:putative mRNA 3-end processing factor